MRLLSILSAFAFATPALAHHPLDGAPMETFAHGVLSGIGHPILGFDHLFFVILVGIVALSTKARLSAPFAYIATMMIGVLAVYFGLSLPYQELGIVVSLIFLGWCALSRRDGHTPKTSTFLAIFALAGLFHGAAFAQSLAGTETGAGISVLLGYLIGLIVTQYFVAVGAGQLVLWVGKHAPHYTTEIVARLSGAAVAGVGVFLLLEMAEGLIL